MNSLLSFLLATALLLVFNHTASACGGLFCQPQQPVMQAGESIAFGVNGNQIEMHVQILYEGPADAFSWVLPIPVTPKEVAVGSDLMFTSLFQTTLPTFTLNVNNSLSTTCAADDFGPIMCPMAMAEAGGAMGGGGATVLEDGTVGPYDYVVLEPEEGNPDSIFQWLETNGYDQPDESAALLNYYALMDQKFVALRLTKNTPSGEIQPLILRYEMENDDANTPIACVPIKLTAIAANDNMPVQVYVFADARAVPLNYLDVTLDDSLVDWVGCMGNPSCYDDNYRARIQQAMLPFENHGFVTEYAGPTDTLQNAVTLVDIDMAQLEASETWNEFFNQLATAGVPAIPFVNNILETHVPNTFDEGPFCADLYLPNQIFNMGNCFDRYVPQDGWTFDAAALAQELDEKVFQPAQLAQDFVDSYSYMTRMYGVLGPDTMDKDPFFTLNSNAPDVSNIHSATATPSCVVGQGPVALDIRVDATDQMVTVPAMPFCNGWRPTDDFVVPAVSQAVTLTSWGFSDQVAQVLARQGDGTFVQEDVDEVVLQADALVVDQTVPAYVVSDSNTNNNPSTNNSGVGKVSLSLAALFIATISFFF